MCGGDSAGAVCQNLGWKSCIHTTGGVKKKVGVKQREGRGETTEGLLLGLILGVGADTDSALIATAVLF